MLKHIKIRSFEVGLSFRDGEFEGILNSGRYWLFDPLSNRQVDVVSRRVPWIVHDKLDVMANSGALDAEAVVIDLTDYQRGLVWIDGRFNRILGPGQYAYWTGARDVRVEIVNTKGIRFDHKDYSRIVRSADAHHLLDTCSVKRDSLGVLFIDGRYVETLEPGDYAFWKDVADARVVEVDQRESMVDVGGQEIMTSDKVTVRMNAVITYRVVDPRRAVCATADYQQTLYRETQLALRAVVGAHELDRFLTEKDAITESLMADIRLRVSQLGLEIVSVGIRDVILPGDMKELMNRVTESQKGCRSQPDRSSRGNGCHAESGQYGKSLGRQPDADALARAGSP